MLAFPRALCCFQKYDALYRLTSATTTGSATYPQWGLSETYDRYGNRTAQSVTTGTGPSNAVTVDATKNRLTGAPFAYDANGNMTNDGRVAQATGFSFCAEGVR